MAPKLPREKAVVGNTILKKKDIRGFALPERSFAALSAAIASKYSLMDFVIKYKDEDGEMVTIAEDDDLVEAFAVTKENEDRCKDRSVLRLEIHTSTSSRGMSDYDADAATPKTSPKLDKGARKSRGSAGRRNAFPTFEM